MENELIEISEDQNTATYKCCDFKFVPVVNNGIINIPVCLSCVFFANMSQIADCESVPCLPELRKDKRDGYFA